MSEPRAGSDAERPDTGPAAPGPEAPASGRDKRPRRSRRWVTALLLGVLLVVVGLVVGILQTGRGQRMVLDLLLERVRGSLAGELRVAEIRSGTLLTGATLRDVELTDSTGRRVLAADSLVVRYLPTGLVSDEPRLRSVIFWGLDFEISTLEEGGSLNLSRIIAPGDPSADTVGGSTELFIGQVGIRRGTVSVLSPAENGSPPRGSRARRTVVPGPFGPLERLGLDGLDADLEDAVLRIEDEVTFASDLASLSVDVSLSGSEEPLRVHEAFGRLSFGPEGLRIEEGAFRLPGTLGLGTFALGPSAPGDGWNVRAELSVDDWGRLADLRWIDPRIPDGTFRGAARVETGEAIDVALEDVDVRLPASNVTFDGGVSFGPTITTRSLVVTASPLVLSRIEPWAGRTMPLDGWLSGRVVFSGPLESLSADGRVTLVPTGYGSVPTTADFSGRWHFGDDLGWTGFEARLDPLNYALVQVLAPESGFTGRGSATVELEGRVASGVGLVADLVHQLDGAEASRVNLRGTLRAPGQGPVLAMAPPTPSEPVSGPADPEPAATSGDSVLAAASSGAWVVDLSGDLSPLSLAGLSSLAPELGLRGLLRGSLTARGPVDALAVAGVLEEGPARVGIDATVDLLDPASGYRLRADARRLALAEFVSRVPEPTEWNGVLQLEGRGFLLDSLDARGSLTAFGSRIGGLRVDTVATALRASQGVLTADSLEGSVAGIRFQGDGRLGLRPGAQGSATVTFGAESLVGLRPFFMGDSLIVRDELTQLEEELLRLQGVDPDTLPSAEDVRVEGAVQGVAELAGRLQDLSVDLRMSVVGGAYGAHQVDSARVRLGVGGLPSLRGRWDVDLDAHGVVWEDRSFQRTTLAGTMVDRAGEGSARIVRSPTQEYEVTGEIVFDSVGGSARLTEAAAVIEEEAWRLTTPAGISWTADAVRVDSLDVRRQGEDPMHLAASGTLARGGASDFVLDLEGFHLDRIGVVLQSPDLDVSGHTDVSLHVRGPAEAPSVDATFTVLDPRYRTIELSRLAGSMTYRDRSAQLSVEAWNGERRALVAGGTVPIDLSLVEVPSRQVDAPMDVEIEADSLDAAVALAYFTMLEDVDGTVSAEVRLQGTTRDPVPSGTVRLSGGAWSVEALGVRHRDVAGTLELTPDQTIQVDLATRGTGTSTVTGSIGLSPLTDPSLDLQITFDRFRAMERLDMEGTISGQFTLGGTYQRPLAEGALTVDQGVIQVDEFSHAAGVVDLTDPRLFGQGLAVDTTVFMAQPILDVRNPFLDNLRLDVDLAVPRDTWLRSNEMNVEMGGELLVRWDRSAGDLVLIGELQALRGTYLVLGRTFEVDEGTVAFIGRPGVNPSLNINATSRVRPAEGDPIEILATVEGTLVQPRVTLTSEGGELSQSDLISYLVFNRAAAELGRGQTSVLNTQINSAFTSAFEGGLSYVAGAFFNQSGTALAQDLGWFDYLSVSSGPTTLEGSGLASAQVEAGRYLSDEVFVAVVFRPLAGQDVDRFGGVRVEWALTDAYNVEAFIEDRFLRSGTGILGLQDLGDEQVYGVLLFREWGYN